MKYFSIEFSVDLSLKNLQHIFGGPNNLYIVELAIILAACEIPFIFSIISSGHTLNVMWP